MTEFRERSGLFKFLYIFLRIITFPIFLVLFIFTHPLWLLLMLLMLAGGAIYWPMSQGVKTDELLSWYQEKYVVVKKDVVKVAKEKGMTNLVPQSIVEEVEQAEDADVPEGAAVSENYNVKIVRDAKSQETKHILKKRGGFKKAAVSEVVKVEKNLEDMTDEEILEESGQQGGGLANLLVSHQDTSSENVAEEAETDDNATVTEENVETATEEQNNEQENTEVEVQTEEGEPAPTPTEAEPDISLMPQEEAQPVEPDDDLDLF